VGATTKRSISPPPGIEEVVPGAAQQETSAVNSPVSAEEGRQDPSVATAVEQPEEAHAEAGAARVAGIVDIASILSALTVTVVRSTL
jgi:hypothetical protein